MNFLIFHHLLQIEVDFSGNIMHKNEQRFAENPQTSAHISSELFVQIFNQRICNRICGLIHGFRRTQLIVFLRVADEAHFNQHGRTDWISGDIEVAMDDAAHRPIVVFANLLKNRICQHFGVVVVVIDFGAGWLQAICIGIDAVAVQGYIKISLVLSSHFHTVGHLYLSGGVLVGLQKRIERQTN